MKIDIEKTYFFTKSHKGHVHTLCGGFAKVLQLITIFERGVKPKYYSITVLREGGRLLLTFKNIHFKHHSEKKRKKEKKQVFFSVYLT